MYNAQNKIIKDKKQLANFFYDSCKDEKNIGVEVEKLCVDKKMKAVSYDKIKKFFFRYNHLYGGKFIFENENPMGLVFDDYSLSLEPGAQMEISLKPYDNTQAIIEKLNECIENLETAAEKFDMDFLSLGLHPLSTYEDIGIIPKARYRIMDEYFSRKSTMSRVMMRETASVQLSFDYSSEKDAITKLRTALKISPFMSALFANSSLRGGRESGFKTYRCLSWLNTDNDRCGLISKKAFGNNFSFEEYTDILLKLPMIFIKRGNKFYKMDGIIFEDFLKNGYKDLRATIEDWKLHLNLYFPDVRLREYIEFRNIDSVPDVFVSSIITILKSIFYDEKVMEDIETILKDLSFEDIKQIRESVPKEGFETKVKNTKILHYIKEILSLVEKNIDNNEKEFLYPFLKMIEKEKACLDLEGVEKI